MMRPLYCMIASAVVCFQCEPPQPTAIAPTSTLHPLSEVSAASAWADSTFSPRKIKPSPPIDGVDLSSLCTPDGALEQAAHALALRLANGDKVDARLAEFEARKAGSPYTWLKTVSVTGDAGAHTASGIITPDVAELLKNPRVRCGLAKVVASSIEASVLVTSEVLADLDRLPVVVRQGQSAPFRALLVKGVTPVAIDIVPPVGVPFRAAISVTNDASGSIVTSSLTFAEQGRYSLQLLADAGQGPRPVLDAYVFSAVNPPSEPVDDTQNHDVGANIMGRNEAMLARINDVRKSRGIAPVRLDAGLSEAAAKHAQRMAKINQLAHTVGDGQPDERAAACCGQFSIVGENVAKADSDFDTHRALLESPSHLANMLEGRFTMVGIGFAQADGFVFVTELFAAR
jgi:uncharacterized protein YkwD